jgi:CTP synthase (UTP-ammonia lyase)
MASPNELHPVRIALVGDRSPLVQAHSRLPDILEALDAGGGTPLDPYWVGTDEVTDAELARFDGIWLLPGSPYRDPDGALLAVRTAREGQIPFLGTCGGFQHLLLEFAAGVCGLDAEHAELVPGAVDPLIRPLACSLVGEERVVVALAGTRAGEILGTAPRTERFFCRYGLEPRYEPVLQRHGLAVGGRDADGEVRLVELSGHPFMLGALFQPELSSSRSFVHPLIAAFIQLVREQALALR